MVTQLTLTQEIGGSSPSEPTMICKKCKIDKEESEFVFKNKKLNIRHCVCKECQKVYKKTYYHENKESHIKRNEKTLKKIDSYILDYKLQHPCILCGENAPECLDFHHIKNKVAEVGKLRKKGSFSKVVEEIKKCVVLCANCHRKVHAGTLKIGR